MNAPILSNVEVISDDKIEILNVNESIEQNDEIAQINARLRASLDSNVTSRIVYETSKSAHSAATKVAKYFRYDFKSQCCKISDAAIDSARRALVADFSFVNDHKRENQAFNVYALEKLAKALYALTNSMKCDKYTDVILRNLDAQRARIEDKSFTFTRKHCYVACSADLTQENVKKSDVKHRLSARDFSTVTTQVSSSLRTLEALRVLRVENDALVSVNFDHAIFSSVR